MYVRRTFRISIGINLKSLQRIIPFTGYIDFRKIFVLLNWFTDFYRINLIVMEKHYILFGNKGFQIVFDAANYGHDILIRGRFHWSDYEKSKVKQIDFMLDNLTLSNMLYDLQKCFWCMKEGRIELHLVISESERFRSVCELHFLEELDMTRDVAMALRIYKNEETVASCDSFVIGATKELNHPKMTKSPVQADKDGSILIGTDFPRR